MRVTIEDITEGNISPSEIMDEIMKLKDANYELKQQNQRLAEALEKSIDIIKTCTCREINYIDIWKVLKEVKGE